MNLRFKDEVWKGGFYPATEAETFEAHLRAKLGLTSKNESARLAIGRSLAEATPPDPVPQELPRGKPIAGEHLFGDEIDLWLAAIIVDGQLGAQASVQDFRAVVEAHWFRGARRLATELEDAADDDVRLLTALADLIPTAAGPRSWRQPGTEEIVGGAIQLGVGKVSQSFPSGKAVHFVINGPGTAPHIAFMGKIGSGKTTTAVQMALELQSKARVPILFIDPKGEFVDQGRVIGALSTASEPLNAIEVGQTPIPLDFLPDPGVGNASIIKAAMQFRDSLALCCRGVGDIQQSMLRTAVEGVIKNETPRDLRAIRTRYKDELDREGKKFDSVMGRLEELTELSVFSADQPPSEFFSRSWVISLKAVGSDELKRLVILLLLDALRSYVVPQSDSPVDNGFRGLRHLLVIDEARRILAERKYESLVELIRQGRSKGQVVMLLSQDPSDFDGQADDFTTQLGTVIAFACAQSQRGLRALQGAYGRRLQPGEFSDTHLPQGVAFAKLPGREAERIQCWAAKQ